ncbi:MAG TPA: hypothetical protein VMG35_15685 [Bryobacteraceae bacterium]|nr:hypothetical protein [Bryobacteraceae bacterium]
MSRILLHIDKIVLKGFDPGDRAALLAGLRSELARVLADPQARAEWAQSQRTPVLRLGAMPLEPGPSGSRKFGIGMARAIGRSLKP